MITTFSNKSFLMAMGFFAAALIMLGLPADAFAGSTNLVDQSKQLAQQASAIPKLITVGAYVIGAFFAVRALFALKGFIESPDDNPITKVLGFGAVSALLIMLPYIINVMTNTIGADATAVQAQTDKFASDLSSGF